MENFFVLGQDRRFDLVSQKLEEQSLTVYRQSTPIGEKAAYLFSLGSDEKEVCSTLSGAQRGSVAFVGRATPGMIAFAKEREMTIVPLMEDETYLLENSLATAEGALSEVIQRTDRLLTEECILICGYGNCGRSMARLFWLCGGEVWVFSREGSLERARQDGFNTYRAPGENMGMFDVILNTVPSPIFSSEFLDAISPGTHFFQIASGSSGITQSDMQKRGILFHPLPGLPGRFSPATEAGAIYRVLNRTLFRSNQESE